MVKSTDFPVVHNIDPDGFIDPDGSVYLYWVPVISGLTGRKAQGKYVFF